MVNDCILERYLDALLKGDRTGCRTVIGEALQSGLPANTVYVDIVWPIMVEIENLMRKGRISSSQEHLAVRINRTIVDQLQNKLPRKLSRNKRIAVCCAATEVQELGAQIMADLFESDGWEVRFMGGGLTNDDILEFVQGYSPNVLLIYGTSPKQAPEIRQLIDRIREVNAQPDMRIMVSGGLFNRAEGLWQEIGADLFAANAPEALAAASSETPANLNEQRMLNRRKKKRGVSRKTKSVETPQ